METQPPEKPEPPELQTVESAWESFAAGVVPKDAPSVQRQEMRRAFYAGAWWFLTGPMESIGHPAISDEESLHYLERLRKELLQFVEDMLNGKR
jgi:hypothetical protein